MKGFRFLGLGGNRSAQREPIKAGLESANKIHIQPQASCIGERKVLELKVVYCTSHPTIRMFCARTSKLSTSFQKIIYASHSKFSKELKNSIKIKVGQAVLKLLIPTTFWLFWSNWKTAWPTKIQIPFFSFLNKWLQHAYVTFKKVLIILS